MEKTTKNCGGKLASNIDSRQYLKHILEILCITLLFAGLFFVVKMPRWDTNDELHMVGIASGIYGEASPYIVHSNILLGFILKVMYGINSEIHWYAIYYFVSLLVSFVAIGYVFYLACGARMGRGLTIILLILSRMDFFNAWNFTRLAGVMSLAGLLLLIYGFRRDCIWTAALGGLLSFSGGICRFDSFLMVAPLCFVLCLLLLYRDAPAHGIRGMIYNIVSKIRKKPAPFLIALCFLSLLFSAKVADEMLYCRDPELAAFQEFNVARSNLVDYEIPYYPVNREDYDALGITENDTRLLEDWTFADPEVFDTQTLNAIREIYPQRMSMDRIRMALKSILLCIPENIWLIFSLAITAGGMLISLIKKEQKGNGVLLLYVVACMLLIYLLARGRFPDRVEKTFSLAFFIAIQLFYLDGKFLKEKNGKIDLAMVMLVLVYFSISVFGGGTSDSCTWIKAYDPNINEVRRSELFSHFPKENMYLRLTYNSESNIEFYYSTFEVPQPGILSNIYTMGSWLTHHPVTKNCLEEYGITNPYRAWIARNDVFMLGSDMKAIEENILHAEERYASQVDWSVVDRFYNTNVIAAQIPTAREFFSQDMDLSVTMKESKINSDYFIRLEGQFAPVRNDAQMAYSLRLTTQSGEIHCYQVCTEEEGEKISFWVEVPAKSLNETVLSAQLLVQERRESTFCQSETIELV